MQFDPQAYLFNTAQLLQHALINNTVIVQSLSGSQNAVLRAHKTKSPTAAPQAEMFPDTVMYKDA